MEIPSITTGLKAMGAAAAFGGDREMSAATALMLAGVGKKLLGGLFKKKEEDDLERKFEKVLNERKSLSERVSGKESSPILNKIKTFIKAMKKGLSKLLTAILAALKTIFTIIKTALMTIAKALFALVKWIGKKILKGLFKSLLKLCKSGALRKMKVRLKVFGRKLKRFVKSPQALAIGGIALGLAGYFSGIFKKEKKEIAEIGDEEDKPDALKEETAAGAPPAPPPDPPGTPTQAAPAPAPETPTQAAPAPAPIPAPVPGTPTQAAPASTPAPAAGTPTQAAPASAPAPAAGTPTPVPPTDGTDPIIMARLKKAVPDKPAPMADGDISDSKAVKLATSNLGISKTEWDIFKNTIAAIESGGKYDIAGGSGNHYDGRYQLGSAAKIDGAKVAGIPDPGHGDINSSKRITFRKNPALQELLFSGYTIANYNYLKNVPEFKNKSKAGQLQALGYAHNQGMGGAENWLKTGIVGADGFGTAGTKYTDAIRRNFIAAGFTGSPSSKSPHAPIMLAKDNAKPTGVPVATGEMGQASGGTTLASAGPTQYDKDKNTQTNVVIASKTNNRTNNVEERKAA